MSTKRSPLGALRVAEAYCYDAGAHEAGKAAKAAIAAFRELIEAQEKQTDALEQIIAILENHRDGLDFGKRLDGWIRAHAFDADKARAALARAQGGDA